MDLQVNREYLTQEGKRVTVLAIEPEHHYPVVTNDGRRCADGSYWSPATFSPRDLAAPVRSKLRIHVITAETPVGNVITFRRGAFTPRHALEQVQRIIDRDDLLVISVEEEQ